MTRRPAPVSRGNPCSPLPKSGTHTSGVVTRKDKVPNVMTIASPAPTKPVFGEKMPKKRQDTDPHNQNTQSMREPISIVLFMPQVLRFIEFAFFQLIFFIFRSILSIKETHKGTVRHKRHNSFGFIVPEFQTTNPYKKLQGLPHG